jgi:hypothetical protein
MSSQDQTRSTVIRVISRKDYTLSSFGSCMSSVSSCSLPPVITLDSHSESCRERFVQQSQVYGIKYKGQVYHWGDLCAEGVCAAKCAELVGISRATYYRHTRILNNLEQGIIPPSKAPKRCKKITVGRGRKTVRALGSPWQ